MRMPTLDLHGIKHANVFSAVDKFIGNEVMKGTREVAIITGYSKPMKKIVNEVLADYGASSQEEWMNPGKLIIDLT